MKNNFSPPYITGQKCFICGSASGYGDVQTCPQCGQGGILDVQYDYDAVRKHLTRAILQSRPFDHWRYKELLPIPEAYRFRIYTWAGHRCMMFRGLHRILG